MSWAGGVDQGGPFARYPLSLLIPGLNPAVSLLSQTYYYVEQVGGWAWDMRALCLMPLLSRRPALCELGAWRAAAAAAAERWGLSLCA